MSQINVERTINTDSNRVWAAIEDFGAIHRFHPGVQTSPIINGIRSGLGAQRTCHFYDGGQATEEVVFVDEGKSLTVSVLEGPLPFHDVEVVFAVTPVSSGCTNISISMDYRPKFGPLGSAMNKIILRRKVSGFLKQVLDGLATHLQTGVLIGQNGKVLRPEGVAA